MTLVKRSLALLLVIFLISCGSDSKPADDSDTAGTNDSVTDTENPDNATDDKETDDKETVDDENTDGCITVTLDQVLARDVNEGEATPYWVYEANYTPDTGVLNEKGNPQTDLFRLFFEGGQEAKTYELGTGVNENGMTCKQCVKIFEDIDPETGKAVKTYFATAGSVEIENLKKVDDMISGESKGSFKGVILSEFAYDESAGMAVPVENGSCIKVIDTTWDTMNCEPTCAAQNRVCGDDGCGGSCGDCEKGFACSGAGQCEEYNCTKINVDSYSSEPYISSLPAGINIIGNVTTDIGQTDIDKVLVQLSNISAEWLPMIAELDGVYNANLANCFQCVLVFEDIGDKTDYVTDSSKIYFQESGQLAVSDMKFTESSVMTDESKGTIKKGTRLVEITIDPITGESIPVTGGKCLEIENDSSWDTYSNCQPGCEDWETCDEPNSKCELNDGRCYDENDCDSVPCVDHYCDNVPVGDNIITNGDFELGEHTYTYEYSGSNEQDTAPLNWGGSKTDINTPSSSGNISLVTNGSGKAVKLVNTSSIVSKRFTTEPFSVTKGDYRCSYKVKGKGTVKMSMYHNAELGAGKFTSLHDNIDVDSDQWSEQVSTMSISKDVPSIFEIVFYVMNSDSSKDHIQIDYVVCKLK